MTDYGAVIERIDREETVELAKQLVSIPSPTGEEGAVAEFVVDWLEDQGIEATLQEIEPGRYNVVGRIRGESPDSGESLAFNGHLDTNQGALPDDEEYLVYGELSEHRSWEPEPYVEDGRIYGAGIADMKGPITSFLMAAKAINEADVSLDGDLITACVAAETGKAQVDGYRGPSNRARGLGTHHLLTGGVTSDYAIVAESSKMGLNWALPGMLCVKLTVRGEPAYWPYIDDDRHAIYNAFELGEFVREWGETFSAENVYEYEMGEIRPVVNLGSFRSGVPSKPTYSPGVANLYVEIDVPPDRTPRDVEREFRGAIAEFDEEVQVDVYKAQKGSAPGGDLERGIRTLSETLEGSYREVYGEDPPGTLDWQQHTRVWHDVITYHHHDIPAVKWGPGPGPETSDYSRRSLSPAQITDAAKAYVHAALSVCG